MLSIVLTGLKEGRQLFSSHLGKEFFESFDNTEVLDADLLVKAAAWKSEGCTMIDCSIAGTITVQCDRCLDDLVLKVDETHLLRVKAGSEEEVPADDDGRETVFISPEDDVFDLSQTVYDYSLLALPLHRVHPEGECNPQVVKHLSKEAAKEHSDSPFAALKGLLDKK